MQGGALGASGSSSPALHIGLGVHGEVLHSVCVFLPGPWVLWSLGGRRQVALGAGRSTRCFREGSTPAMG